MKNNNFTQKNNDLAKRLARYSSTAGIMMAIAPVCTNAQISYSGEQNISLSSNGDTYSLDMDGDENTDFKFELEKYNSSYTDTNRNVFFSNYYNEIKIRNNSATANSWINKPLSKTSYSINKSDTNFTNTNTTYLAIKIKRLKRYSNNETNYETYKSGNFLDTENKYLGVKFKIGTDTHYGWIRLTIPANASTLTIVDWAYETTADEGIKTGATGVSTGISNSTENSISIYPNPVQNTMVINGFDNDAVVNVINSLGQSVAKQSITAGESIDLSNQSAGIYIVKIENQGNTITKKIIKK